MRVVSKKAVVATGCCTSHVTVPRVARAARNITIAMFLPEEFGSFVNAATMFRTFRQRAHFRGSRGVGVRLIPPTMLLRLVPIELHAEQRN